MLFPLNGVNAVLLVCTPNGGTTCVFGEGGSGGRPPPTPLPLPPPPRTGAGEMVTDVGLPSNRILLLGVGGTVKSAGDNAWSGSTISFEYRCLGGLPESPVDASDMKNASVFTCNVGAGDADAAPSAAAGVCCCGCWGPSGVGVVESGPSLSSPASPSNSAGAATSGEVVRESEAAAAAAAGLVVV